MILIDQLGPGGRDPNFPLSRAELRSLCGRLLDGLGLSGREFELTLTRDGDMAGINADFSGIFAPTNVLSFPAHEVLGDGEGGLPGCALSGDADPAFLGSLVLSVDTLAREAFLYGQDPAAHLARLLAHGLLHLAGVEHGAEMEERTEAALIQAFFPEEGDSGDSPALDGGTP